MCLCFLINFKIPNIAEYILFKYVEHLPRQTYAAPQNIPQPQWFSKGVTFPRPGLGHLAMTEDLSGCAACCMWGYYWVLVGSSNWNC